MTSSCFGTLAYCAADSGAHFPKRSLPARLASRLTYYCQYPLDRFIKAFADGAVVHYWHSLPAFSADAWADKEALHVRVGRFELEVFRKRTPEARVASALEDAQSRYDYEGIWDEMVALGIKEEVGAPARELIYQGRWTALEAWVKERHAALALKVQA